MPTATVSDDLPELLSRQEVADLLRISAPTLRAGLRSGQIPAPSVWIGPKAARWRRADLVNWMAGDASAKKRVADQV